MNNQQTLEQALSNIQSSGLFSGQSLATAENVLKTFYANKPKLGEVEQVKPAINAKDLNTQAVTLPKAPSDFQAVQFNVPAMANQPFSLEQQAMQAQQTREQARGTLAQLFERLTGQSARQEELLKQEQVVNKQQFAKELAADFKQTQLDFQDEIDTLEKQSGGLVGGTNAAVSRRRYEQSKTLANKAIALETASGNYEDAVNIVNSKIQAEFQPIREQIQYVKEIMELTDLTETERMFVTQQANRESNRIEILENTKIALSRALIENNRADLIPQLDAATSAPEMMSIAGQFGIPVADALDKQIKQATLKKLQIDAAAAVQKLEEPAPSSSPLAQAQLKGGIDLMETLAKDGYLSSSVGANPFARFSLVNFATGGKQNFIAGISQLKQQLTLDQLANAKANGATFGALSDAELSLIAQSATKIGSWEKLKDGKVVGYDVSEKEFRKELDKIKNFAKLDYLLRGGAPQDIGATVTDDGKVYTQNYDGSFSQIYP